MNGGTAFGNGRVNLSVDAYRSTPQSASTTDLRLVTVRPFGYPGNVRGERGTYQNPREISPLLTAAAEIAGAIAPGETVNRVIVPPGQDGTNLTLLDFLDSVNTFGTNEDIMKPISVSPGSDRYTIRAGTSQRVADWLNVDAGFTYARRETFSASGAAGRKLTFRVAAENPYNPFGNDVAVDKQISGFGAQEATGERDRLTVSLDLDGEFGGGWDWEIRSRFADSESMVTTTNLINPKALDERVGESRTDPSNALNVFGGSFFTDGNNAELLAGEDVYIPEQESVTGNRLGSSDLIIRGNLFSLPAGPIRAVAGAEWRKTSLDVDYGTTFLRVINSTSPVASKIGLGFTQKGTRTIQAGFAEILVPIFSKTNDLPGIRDRGGPHSLHNLAAKIRCSRVVVDECCR